MKLGMVHQKAFGTFGAPPTGRSNSRILSSRNPREMARVRAATQHLSHVSLQPTAIADIVLDEPVDAVIGRLSSCT